MSFSNLKFLFHQFDQNLVAWSQWYFVFESFSDWLCERKNILAIKESSFIQIIEKKDFETEYFLKLLQVYTRQIHILSN